MSAYKKLRALRFFTCLILTLAVLSVHSYALGISAEGYILIDASSGEVLYGSNYNMRMPMASTTKIMTAVVAIENMPLDTRIIIPREAVGIEGSSIYLCEGESLTLEELLYALLLSSANDAATAIAISVGGDVDGFANMMNDTAKRLGLEDSHFMNPHGLDNAEHYTTAKDLAKLTAYALTLPKFKEIVSTYKKSISFNNKEGGRLLVNHNKLLNAYPDTIGVKTGFTKRSGRCLVSAAERNGTILIAVTLNAPDDWRDHKTMLDYGFDNYESVELGNFSFEIPVVSGNKEIITCTTDQIISVLLPKDHGSLEWRLEVYPFVYAPVEIDEKLGRIVYFCDGKEIGALDITAAERVDISAQKYTIWNRLFDKNKD